jgi:hypothetical protein
MTSANLIKYADLVTKLTRLTQEKELIWQLVRAEQVPKPSNELWGSMYSAEYKGREMYLYEKRCRVEGPSVGEMLIRESSLFKKIFPHVSKDSEGAQGWHWQHEIVLDVINPATNSKEQLPYISTVAMRLRDLLEAVRKQISPLDDWIDTALSE